MWFCGDDIDHTIDLANIVIDKPTNRPSIWPVAIGTCVETTERDALWAARFDLNITCGDAPIQSERGLHVQKETTSSLYNGADMCHEHCDGKKVIIHH